MSTTTYKYVNTDGDEVAAPVDAGTRSARVSEIEVVSHGDEGDETILTVELA